MVAELVELTVEEIVGGGDGLARLESGRVVFVPRTAPGDRVVARLTDNRARWSRGRVVEWKHRGPDRVTPVCGHYEGCGGCSVQHLSVRAQTDALHRAVGDALSRIGGSSIPIQPLEPAVRRFGYRNRVTFTLRRERGRVTAGYHRIRGPRLTDIVDCPLAEAPIRETWKALRGGWGKRAEALPLGRELKVSLRASVSGQVALLVTGGTDPGHPAKVMHAAPMVSSYWWRPARGDRRHLAGTEHFEDVWTGVRVPLRPEAFLQVNRELAPAIDAHLADGLGPVAGRRIADLYAGVGLRAVEWARDGAEVTMVEENSDAIETARALASAAPSSFGIRHARVEQALADVLPADVVLVNPPRGGLGPAVTERLVEGGADQLVYVSCDPGTLARDLARLAARWRPTVVQPFDAFPQTGHVETVAWLERVS